ncbi:MAG: phosphoribosyl-ATP diphosphatase [Blastocatellia bacterium]|nr:phosphoribosyl-ATP diphosphatase [Blastocatellia bacterium]
MIQDIRFDEEGLVPAVVQDGATGQVIALCCVDNAGLIETLQTGEAAFFSSKMPASSGQGPHRLLDIRINDDGRSLTVLIEREGKASSEQKPSSLLRSIERAKKAEPEVSLVDVGSMEFGLAINNLYALIAERKRERPEGSYTTYLFDSGLDKILKKIAEEAGEVIIAAKNRSPNEIISELADLFYHLLVLMVEREVELSDVHKELVRRAARAPQPEQG